MDRGAKSAGKRRIELLFGTLQDGLVKEMRLEEIDPIDAARITFRQHVEATRPERLSDRKQGPFRRPKSNIGRLPVTIGENLGEGTLPWTPRLVLPSYPNRRERRLSKFNFRRRCITKVVS